MIPELTIPSLKCLSVTITGDWLSLPKRDWRGCVVCEEPIVGIAILETPTNTTWAISGRHSSEVGLLIGRYDKIGCDVQVSFSVGRGISYWRTLVASSNYIPDIPSKMTLLTGSVSKFCVVDGQPNVTLKVLFIAKSDVKSGRNGIWHVRTKLQDDLPLPMHQMLTYGRTGTV